MCDSKIELLVDSIKKNINELDNIDIKELERLYLEAKSAYYNSDNPIISDDEFDLLEEKIRKRKPKSSVLKITGFKTDINQKPLAFWCGSMDKIKQDDGEISKWKKKYDGPYTTSIKLDGISGLFILSNSELNLYTRGNGKVGSDISHVLKFININSDIEKLKSKYKELAVRGEIIISKENYDKYKNIFSNSRNMVSGIINSKNVNIKYLKDLDFVAYELIVPRKKPSEQFKLLNEEGFNVVFSENVENINSEILTDKLIELKKKSIYEIDGVIVCQDKENERNKSGNPKYAFAFKMNFSDQIVEVEVIDVEWSPSKDGYLKPRVKVNPISLSGAEIRYATGFNAKFVCDNSIAPGAKVKLVRSGEVIPHIISVTKKANYPKLPDVDYEWNDTKIDIVLTDKDNEDVRQKNIIHFFKVLGAKNISSGLVKKLYSKGYDSIETILKMNISDYLEIDGFKEKLAEKIQLSIKSVVENVYLANLIVASNIFGHGFALKKVEQLISNYPDILEEEIDDISKVNKICKIDGFSEITANNFVKSIEKYNQFMNNLLSQGLVKIKKEETNIKQKDNIFTGKNIVFTGFRDKIAEKYINESGGKIVSTVNKKTNILVIGDKESNSSKLLLAKKMNDGGADIEIWLKEKLLSKIHKDT